VALSINLLFWATFCLNSILADSMSAYLSMMSKESVEKRVPPFTLNHL
jgi:hypothetical protein